MKSMSISFRKSATMTSLNHNNRINVHHNVDASRTSLNYYHQENIQDVYTELFEEAVNQFNAKQKRNDRKITDYYDKIKNDKKTHVQQEIIVQVGKKEDMIYDSEEWKTSKQIMLEYVNDFIERNPNLRVYNVALHLDESVPHLHINFVPFYHSEKGLSKRVGMNGALIEQGNNEQTPFQEWRDKEVAYLEKRLQTRDISREKVGTHKYLHVTEFKEMKAEISKLDDKLNEKQEQYQEYAQIEAKMAHFEPKKGLLGYSDNEVEKALISAKSLVLENDNLKKELETSHKALKNANEKNQSLEKRIQSLKMENEELEYEKFFFMKFIEKENLVSKFKVFFEKATTLSDRVIDFFKGRREEKEESVSHSFFYTLNWAKEQIKDLFGKLPKNDDEYRIVLGDNLFNHMENSLGRYFYEEGFLESKQRERQYDRGYER